MRKYLFILSICFIAISCTDLNNEINSNNFQMNEFTGRSVVFYNVENLFDTKHDPGKDDEQFTPFGEYEWDDERYQKKLGRISDALSFIQEKPVLVGLAEIENYNVLNDLVKQDIFKNQSMGIIHFESPDRRGIDCALLYDKKVFKVIDSENIPITLDYNPAFNTRDILYVKGEMMGGVITHVFVNHWSSRREGKAETSHKRERAATILRAKIDELTAVDPKANILVLGDFNDHPDDRSLEKILKAKESGYANDGDLINLFYDDNENDLGTSVYMNDWAVLDQIIVSQSIYDGSNKIGIEKRNGFILDNEELLFTQRDGNKKPNSTYGGRRYYGGYSDHLPVYIILK
jgi:predicted extracellular nuclease